MGNSHSTPSDSSSNSQPVTCPALPTPVDDADIVIGNFTVHQFLQVLSGAAAIVAILVSLLLFFQHAFNIRNPREQIKLMRIITIIPVYAGLTFACLCLGQNSIYLSYWIEIWEAICVCSFFMLVLTYINPDPESQLSFFENLPLWNHKKQVVGESSARFYKNVRMAVYQMIPALVIISIAVDITQAVGVYCINSNGPHFAHIWVTVLHGITTTVAVMAVIRFCARLRSELPERRIWSQLFAFKSIIGLSGLQTFGFNIAAGDIAPTSTLSYNDISIGIPSALLILEMVIFALAFHKFYSHSSYTAGGANALGNSRPVMSSFLAVAKALNPLEVLEEMVAAFTGRAGGKHAYQYAAQTESHAMVPKRPSLESMIPSPPQQSHPHEQVQAQRLTRPSGLEAPTVYTGYAAGSPGVTPYGQTGYGYGPGQYEQQGNLRPYSPPRAS